MCRFSTIPSTTKPLAPVRTTGAKELVLGDWSLVRTTTASKRDVLPSAFPPTMQVVSGSKSRSNRAKQRKSLMERLRSIWKKRSSRSSEFAKDLKWNPPAHSRTTNYKCYPPTIFSLNSCNSLNSLNSCTQKISSNTPPPRSVSPS